MSLLNNNENKKLYILNNLFKKNMIIFQNINSKRRKHLHYIAFIKFLALLLIIKWHIFSWIKKPIDLGARMCEILFITSGFLVGYNYYGQIMPNTYKYSFKYAYKHLRIFYPLEFLTTIYSIHLKNKKLDITDIEILLLSFFMI